MGIGDPVDVIFSGGGPVRKARICDFPSPGRVKVKLDSAFIDGQIEIEVPQSALKSDGQGGWTLTLP